MRIDRFKKMIADGGFDDVFTEKCGIAGKDISDYRNRWVRISGEFSNKYGDSRDIIAVSVGGRSEIAGNHTDHQGGNVLCCSVNRDIIAVVSKRNDDQINLQSEKFREDHVNIDKVLKNDYKGYTRSSSIIAGICKGISDRGFKLGGFDAYTTSDIGIGSGLSSSAAFECLVVGVINELYCDRKIDLTMTALIGQYAENVFFGKKCGLMDQLICALGNCMYANFGDPLNPEVEQKDFDLSDYGYKFGIIKTGDSHVDLSDEYSSVANEMKEVASYYRKDRLCEINKEDIIRDISKLRNKFGDRPVLRAMHYYQETERVLKIKKSMDDNDVDHFIEFIDESGRSSAEFLQNIYPASHPDRQGITLAYCITEMFLHDHGAKGACRVHGGGFGGSAFVIYPSILENEYTQLVESVFGKGSLIKFNIRKQGIVVIK